jgi:hypothetical protein
MHGVCRLQLFDEQRRLDEAVADDALEAERAVVDEATIEVSSHCASAQLLLLWSCSADNCPVRATSYPDWFQLWRHHGDITQSHAGTDGRGLGRASGAQPAAGRVAGGGPHPVRRAGDAHMAKPSDVRRSK